MFFSTPAFSALLLDSSDCSWLNRAGYQVYVGTLGDKEVDFVASKGDRLIYVQCTYLLVDEDTIRREYAPRKPYRTIMKKWWSLLMTSLYLPTKASDISKHGTFPVFFNKILRKFCWE